MQFLDSKVLYSSRINSEEQLAFLIYQLVHVVSRRQPFGSLLMMMVMIMTRTMMCRLRLRL